MSQCISPSCYNGFTIDIFRGYDNAWSCENESCEVTIQPFGTNLVGARGAAGEILQIPFATSAAPRAPTGMPE